MLRLSVFAFVAAGLIPGLSVPTTAAAQLRSAGLRPVALAAGAGGRDWRTTLSPGARLPNHERLVVVAEDGRILRIVDGEDTQVHLPLDLHLALAAGALRATLVHNHLADQSFSCADFRQLTTTGVDGVVVVGNSGSVFEVTAGPRYDARVFEEVGCRRLLDMVARQLASEVGYAFGEGSELAAQVPHLLASALAGLGIIQYTMTPAIQTRIALSRHRVEFSRVVSLASREIARRVSGHFAAPADN